MKKKILWISEYRVNTGFSRVTESILKHLSAQFDITLLDIYRTIEGKYNVTDQPEGSTATIKIAGRTSVYDTWSIERLKSICEQFDAIFIIQDIWNINDILEALRPIEKKLPPIVAYFPIDAVDHDTDWYKNFDMLARAVTYTEFAKSEVIACLEELYTGIFLDEQLEKLMVIPHGVDTEKFYKLPATKQQLRKNLFKTDRCANSFFFLNANRNQPRKRLDITLKAFQLFLEQTKATDAFIYMHCGNTDSHIDVKKMAIRYGIGGHLIMTTDKVGIPSFSDEELNVIYNASDAGINTSMGEGWGLTSVEHAATGAPQLVPAHSACKELFGDLMPTIYAPTSYTMDNRATTGKLVEPSSLATLMGILYTDREKYDVYAKSCHDKFTSEQYQWQNICELWKNIFESL